MKKRRIKFPFSMRVLLPGILLTAVFSYWVGWTELGQKEQEILHTAEVYAARIELLLNTLFNKTDVLKAVVVAGNGEIGEEEFVNLAESMYDLDGIRAIQYLPRGTVTYCYPIEGNEATIGGNVFENPKRRDDALLAVNTKQIALSGPYTLTQGGLGLVVRNPVFFKDEDGIDIFWGFAAIILDLPEALNSVGLEELEREGYEYCLHCVVESGEEMMIKSSTDLRQMNSTDSEIQVPNHVWVLSLIEKNQWAVWTEAVVCGFVGVLASFCLAGYIYQSAKTRRILSEAACRDELTGLWNRRGFFEKLEEWCRNPGDPFVLVYLDLNYFKEVNDRYGHQIGDFLLCECAARLRMVGGSGSVCARIGGDEFVLLLRGMDLDSESLSTAMKKVTAEPAVLDGKKLKISFSTGNAFFPADSTEMDELIRIADEQMYQNKKKSRKTGAARVCSDCDQPDRQSRKEK